jgi:peptide/nickel transport system permease protein
MQKYMLRRVVLMIPTLLIVSVIIFGMMRLVPGDVIMSLLGEGGRLSDSEAVALRTKLGLNDPIHVQYLKWMSKLVVLNLGDSLLTGQSVNSMVASFFPVTFELVIVGTIIGMAMALPLGILSAVYVDTWIDYASRLFAITGISVPNFWIATLVVVMPAIWWGISPPIERVSFFDDPMQHAFQFFIPAIILGYGLSATKVRLLRTTMLEVLREDYIRTARSKGLRDRTVYVRHALKNALIPVITLLGTQVGRLMGGTVILEVVFGLPGMGKMAVDAISLRDYPVVQGMVMIVAVIMVVMNLIVDMSYAWFDPRIRYS